MEEARVDKWLWAVRIFKTRSIATDACKKGRVAVGGTVVKPSRMIHVGDIVSVRKPPIEYSFRVIQLLGARVGETDEEGPTRSRSICRGASRGDRDF